jgi:hypothetical protein
MKRGSSSVFNLLSVVLVGLTALTSLCYMVMLVNPHIFFNPFPPPQSTAAAAVTPPAPSPTGSPALPPTYTPTNTPTITLTPLATRTRSPTRTPTASPTWPPTLSPTPRVTRSPDFPFTWEVTYRRPEYDNWSGVAGHVEDLDGNPLPGYAVRVDCPGAGTFDIRAGDNQRHNGVYGNIAAWEQACNPSAYVPMEVRVQLWCKEPDENGNCLPTSNVAAVQLPGYSSRSLGYVVFTLNWEELQPTKEPTAELTEEPEQ